MNWVFLIAAILSEVTATLCLRTASQGGSRKWLIGTVAGYLAAFTGLTLALDGGLALGVAHGIRATAVAAGLPGRSHSPSLDARAPASTGRPASGAGPRESGGTPAGRTARLPRHASATQITGPLTTVRSQKWVVSRDCISYRSVM